MDTQSVQPARGGTWRLAAVFGAVLLLALLVGAPIASAQSPIPGETGVACMNMSPCTAGDTRIANITVLNVPACVDDGTGNLFADVLLKATIETTADARYDIGLWVAMAGGSANTGPGNQCYHGILRPLETPSTPFNADGGPFRDLDADYCGDMLKTDGLTYGYLQSLHVKCTDTSGTGLMNSISTCTSYDNNSGTACNVIADAVPGTGSKCKCESTTVTPPIPISQIVVRKLTNPSTDATTSFGFTASGPNLNPNPTHFNLINGGSWSSGQLPSGGTYSVVEDTPPLSWVQASVVCTDGANTYTNTSFIMPAGKTVVCTFTNNNPTPVKLRSFTATGAKKAIKLKWRTANEVNNLGFNLYRATRVDGKRTKLNAEMIPTLVPPGSPLGAVYEWTDTTVRGARLYYYWVEDVGINGGTSLHGPVRARAR